MVAISMEIIIFSVFFTVLFIVIAIYAVKKIRVFYLDDKRKHIRKVNNYISSCFRIINKKKYDCSIFVSFTENEKCSKEFFDLSGFNKKESSLKIAQVEFWNAKNIALFDFCLDEFDDYFYDGLKAIVDKLYKKRRRRPINGIILPVSISKIINDKISNDTFTLRYLKCCKYIEERFKQKIPVVIFPIGINNIKNFHAFYSCLDREEKLMPLGFCSSNTEKGVDFDLSWNDFVNSLFDNTIEKLNSVDSDLSKKIIYFLSQIVLLGGQVESYLSYLGNHLFNKNIFLSGVFFCPKVKKA